MWDILTQSLPVYEIMSLFSQEEIRPTCQKRWKARAPQQIIAWAVETFAPQIAVSSSFQTQSLPLLHIVSRIDPKIFGLFPRYRPAFMGNADVS
jgi:3'-phosphoadenosine 5'-phosphosulfate sulfotransferase (PAPS reductase)/FAD synthetase